MSTAGAFLFFQSFPWCPQDISGTVPAVVPHVDNLSLADAMAFVWNFETFTITLTGTTSLGGTSFNAAATYTLSPIASSVCDEANNGFDCDWYGAAFAALPFGSFPNIRSPRARVCQPATDGRLFAIQMDVASTGLQGFIAQFWLGTDPSNSGKYRIYYRFFIDRVQTAIPLLEMQWNTDSSVPISFASLASGTITIGGLSMNYYSFYRTGGGRTATGGTMAASSSSFTY